MVVPSSTNLKIARAELRPTVMTVSLSALSKNFETLGSIAAPAKVMAVVKANAYGHGLVPCAEQLVKAGAEWFGVAFVEEGIELRESGITCPILVFGGIFESQIRHFIDYDLDLTASSLDKLQGIEETAAWLGKTARVHLKIDTGMQRIGVHHYSAEPFIKAATKLKHSEIVGVFSHLATAAENQEFAHEQLRRFTDVVSLTKKEFTAAGLKSPLFHLANTAGSICLPEAQFDMVRCGIGLYGVYPDPSLRAEVELQPAMKLHSRIVYFKVVKKGSSVGYGQSWTAPEDCRIVTVPIGYGDGYFRSLSNCGEVLIRAKRYPIVGRVNMDQIMVNIGQDTAYVGDEVVLIGSQRGEGGVSASLSVGEVAERAGSYSYEMLTNTNMRVPRVYC